MVQPSIQVLLSFIFNLLLYFLRNKHCKPRVRSINPNPNVWSVWPKCMTNTFSSHTLTPELDLVKLNLYIGVKICSWTYNQVETHGPITSGSYLRWTHTKQLQESHSVGRHGSIHEMWWHSRTTPWGAHKLHYYKCIKYQWQGSHYRFAKNNCIWKTIF